MRTVLLLLICVLPLRNNGQVITTIAGTGVAGNTGDGGMATAAAMNYPIGGAFDNSGNYFFATGTEGNSVRKISTSGIITTIAGTGNSGYNGDGIPATSAYLKNPQQVAVDKAGNVYISDAYNNRIRKVDISTGLISTLAGTGIGGYNGDNITATTARIYNPEGICFNLSGELLFAESANSRIRKIDASGIISTVAGTGICGTGGNGIPATSAPICVFGVCVDNSGNIYIADGAKRVYKVNTSGVISFYAGNGSSGYSGDGGPATVAMTTPYFVTIDNYNNLYIVEYDQSRIRVVDKYGYINTITGTGIAGFSGDNGNSRSAQVNFPGGLAVDSCNNLYISDTRTYRIRKISYPSCHYLGTENEQLSTAMSIYPNPANDELHLDNLTTETSYTIFNAIGQSLQQGSLKKGSNKITVRSLANGLYLLQLVDNAGTNSVSRFVKE